MMNRNRNVKPQLLWSGTYATLSCIIEWNKYWKHKPVEITAQTTIQIIYIVIHKASMIYKQYRLCYWHKKQQLKSIITFTWQHWPFILLLSDDIELNPGPKSIDPCGICERIVKDNHRAFCCDGCDIWCHKTCISMCTQSFEYLQNRSICAILHISSTVDFLDCALPLVENKVKYLNLSTKD